MLRYTVRTKNTVIQHAPEERANVKVFEGGYTRPVMQQSLGRHDDQRLAIRLGKLCI